MADFLSVQSLKHCFGSIPVLNIEAFRLEAAQEVALRGPSGLGKTTFLNLIAGLLPIQSGSIILKGQELRGMSEVARDRFRAQQVGYIFQSFRLLPSLSSLENVLLGMSILGKPDEAWARQLLDRVGLGERLHSKPRQLSAGQRQRVAVARALANRPSLVLADEPTGSLDPENAGKVLTLLRELCHSCQASLLLVSHDSEVLRRFPNCFNFVEVNGLCHS